MLTEPSLSRKTHGLFSSFVFEAELQKITISSKYHKQVQDSKFRDPKIMFVMKYETTW